MPDIPNFSMQNNFPVASVIQAAQENAQRQQQAREQGQQSLLSGLGAIGSVGQSLLDRRRAMAQAMAGAQLYANSPEGKEMLGGVSTTTPAPVAQRQTAAYDPNTGSVTPNMGTQGAVTARPQTTTAPPQMDLQTLATAFMGDKPSDVLSQLFQRHKLNVESGLKAQEIAQQGAIAKALAQLKGQEVSIQGKVAQTGAAREQSQDVDTLLQRRAELTKSLSKGWWDSINNDQAVQAKRQVADIDSQLLTKGYRGDLTNTSSQGGKFTSPRGTNFTVNP